MIKSFEIGDIENDYIGEVVRCPQVLSDKRKEDYRRLRESLEWVSSQIPYDIKRKIDKVTTKLERASLQSSEWQILKNELLASLNCLALHERRHIKELIWKLI